MTLFVGLMLVLGGTLLLVAEWATRDRFEDRPASHAVAHATGAPCSCEATR